MLSGIVILGNNSFKSSVFFEFYSILGQLRLTLVSKVCTKESILIQDVISGSSNEENKNFSVDN